MIDALARLANRRPGRVAIAAALFFAAAAAIAGSVAEHLDPYGGDDPATEAVKARKALFKGGMSSAGAILVIRDAPVDTPRGRARVAAIAEQTRRIPGVKAVHGYLDTRDPDFVSNDGQSTYLAVGLKPIEVEDKPFQEVGAAIADRFDDRQDVIAGGASVLLKQVNKQQEKDLQKGELIAFPLLFLLAFVFFRSLVAAMLPVMVGALAIAGTLVILRLASEVGSISIYALNLTTALGLGLAIDYSLFVVSRYREEIAKHGPGLTAMRRVMATAGRTVLFSSLTVAAAMAALLVFPQRFLYSMGIGGTLVALFAALVALTVLPAVLTLLGARVNGLSPGFLRRRAEAEARSEEQGFWYRLSRFVMRRPVGVATASAVLLIAMGLPFLGAKFDRPDLSMLGTQASSRQAYDILRSEFPPYRETPIWIALRDGSPLEAAELHERIRRTDGVAKVSPPQRLTNDLVGIQAISTHPYIAEQSQDLVERLRDLPVREGALEIGGPTAEFLDLRGSILRHGPTALAIIVVCTLLILFLMTGSVILPIKSLIMNMLSLAAVFGTLVFVFQDGRLEGLLDYTSSGAIDMMVPILLFAVAFGLSTDYAVFLLSRIKEARESGASETECVAIGLERTGRIVTAAALLFAIALGAQATSQIAIFKQYGLGTALAVLIDASIVRALLVPSLMALLGKWNWWAPAPLRRLHERVGIGEAAPVAEQA